MFMVVPPVVWFASGEYRLRISRPPKGVLFAMCPGELGVVTEDGLNTVTPEFRKVPGDAL